ncbi:MAG: hypothetical protein HQM16_07665 [Deltaproteobacteria bacterium]|nr:hypothetical protein [Deltaproteobacteria bacterium]
MFTTPLEDYLKTLSKRPEIFDGPSCSACWRGYVGTWVIKEGFLYLVDLKAGDCTNEKTIPLKKIFAGQKGPVRADWFSGTIRLPKGNLTQYVHMGFASQYERYLLIEIDKGRVISEKEVRNSKVQKRE